MGVYMKHLLAIGLGSLLISSSSALAEHAFAEDGDPALREALHAEREERHLLREEEHAERHLIREEERAAAEQAFLLRQEALRMEFRPWRPLSFDELAGRRFLEPGFYRPNMFRRW